MGTLIVCQIATPVLFYLLNLDVKKWSFIGLYFYKLKCVGYLCSIRALFMRAFPALSILQFIKHRQTQHEDI